MSEVYSSDEENRDFIRKYDSFDPLKGTRKIASTKQIKFKNVSYCTFTMKKGPKKGQMCNKDSILADGFCHVHRRVSLVSNSKKVKFNRLKKAKIYHLVKCLDKKEPIVLLKDGDSLIRVRLPRNMKPIPRVKINYLAFSRVLPEGKRFAMWKRCQE